GRQAHEVNERRKSQRQIAFVGKNKIGEGEVLSGAGGRVDADVHGSSLSDLSRRANCSPQSKPWPWRRQRCLRPLAGAAPANGGRSLARRASIKKGKHGAPLAVSGRDNGARP